MHIGVSSIPHRQSLANQTIACLSAEIEGRTWRDWLPSERALAETLLVSRNTLRVALGQMRRSGAIQTVHGRGHRILVKKPRRPQRLKSHDVALLLPEPLEMLRPTLALWINELRTLLNESGCNLHEFSGSQYFRANSGPALRKLTDLNPHGCWILVLSTESLQEWFLRSRLPCIVAGTCYPSVDLVSVDVDHRAGCRHAAGMLLRLGHRHIALLNRRVRQAGDLESELGFVEGVRFSAHPDAFPLVVYHESSIKSIGLCLGRLMDKPNRPTALLVANPYYYLTVTSHLMQLGWRIPHDISVLSRDEDPFLSFLLPTPSRYTIPAHLYARRLLRPIAEMLERGGATRRTIRIMPDFIKGESVASPPPA